MGVFDGDSNNNSLTGSAGDDTIYGREGDDTLNGGLGNNVLHGGSGFDTVDYRWLTTPLYVDLSSGSALGFTWKDVLIAIEAVLGGQDNDRLTGDDFGNQLNGGTGNDTLDGLGGNDDMAGELGADDMSGGDGNDTLSGGSGNDFMSGDSGNDHLYGDADADRLFGGDGADTLDGGTGNDTLRGNDGDDQLVGGDGSDWLYGDGGTDTLDGGDGNDTLFGETPPDDSAFATLTARGPVASNDPLSLALAQGSSEFAGNDLLDGGSGTDTAVYRFNRDTYTLLATPTGFSVSNGVMGTQQLSNIEFVQFLDQTVTLEKVAPTLQAFSPADGASGVPVGQNLVITFSEPILRGSGLVSVIPAIGGGGVAVVEPTPGSWATVSGNQLVLDPPVDLSFGTHYFVNLPFGAVTDLLGNPSAPSVSYEFFTAADPNQPTEGNDTLTGTDGHDTLFGLGGNDLLLGLGGDDLLDGGPGADTMEGGSGSDTYHIDSAGDRVVEGAGAAGFDTVWLDTTVYSFADVFQMPDQVERLLLSESALPTWVYGTPSPETIQGNAGANGIGGKEGNDTVYGGAGNDTLIGDAGDDQLYGEAGNDSLYGSDGNDVLSGGEGDDRLSGEIGDDALVGGAGNDTLDGGSGTDDAVYSGFRNTYVITPTSTGFTISSAGEGTDTLTAIEFAKFADQRVDLSPFNGPVDHPTTGSLTVRQIDAQGRPLGTLDPLLDTPRQGVTLEVVPAGNGFQDEDGLVPGSDRLVWLRDGEPIPGATGSRYALSQADVGATIGFEWHVTDQLGNPAVIGIAAFKPVAEGNERPTGTVTITGTARQGETLTASNTLADADGIGTVHYQWIQGLSASDPNSGTDIPGATGATLRLSQLNVDQHTIGVRAFYTDAEGQPESLRASQVLWVENTYDAPQGQVVIRGSAAEDQLLRADTAGISDPEGLNPFHYQWLRGGHEIAGATGSTYLLGQADVGQVIDVRVSYDARQWPGVKVVPSAGATAPVANVNDPAVGEVTILGTAIQGQTLGTRVVSLSDPDGVGPITSTQWLRGDVPIAGATGPNYTLTQADIGSRISAQVGFTDGGGSFEQVTSSATPVVSTRVVFSTVPLTFTTQGPQSLWTAGGPAGGYEMNTGNALVFSFGGSVAMPGAIRTPPVNLGFLGTVGPLYLGGVYGSVDISGQVGLYAWASLPSAGSWEGSATLNVTVGRPAGIDTRVAPEMTFQFSMAGYGTSSIQSTAFSGGGAAGLDLVVGAKAGLHNFVIDVPVFGKTGTINASIVDLPVTHIPLVTIGLANSQSIDLGPSFTLNLNEPTGADTQAVANGQSSVTASGASTTNIVSLGANLGEMLAELVNKIPGAVAAGAALNLLFKTWHLDISGQNIRLGGNVLTVGAEVGIGLTEKVKLDLAPAQVAVRLRSDNGTPDNPNDDKTVAGIVGQSLSLPAPSGPDVPHEGTATVSAYFDLQGAVFEHKLGFGMNSSLSISALSARLTGRLVPDLLSVQFGPLVGPVTFRAPTVPLFDGFPAITYTIPSAGEHKAFNTVTSTFEVYYTDNAPPDWNPQDGDPRFLALDAVQRTTPNAPSFAAAPTALWAGSPGQTLLQVPAGSTTVPAGTQDTSWAWNAASDATLLFADSPGFHNTFVVATASAGAGLRANAERPSGALAVPAAIGSDAPLADLRVLLHSLADATVLQVQAGDDNPLLRSNHTVEMIGSDAGDLLVMLPDAAGGPHLFDGGGQGPGEHDIFMADLLASDPDTPVVWNLDRAVADGVGVNILGQPAGGQPARPIDVHGVEAMWLITGNQPDLITTHVFSDHVDTSGGDDLVFVVGDQAADEIQGGDGDDQIVVSVVDPSAPLPAAWADTVFGGRGRDLVLHVQQGHQALRLDLLADGRSLFGSDGLGADASLSDLLHLLREQSVYLIDPGNAEPPIERSGSDDFLVLINGSAALGSTRYSSDIEALAVTGSDQADDLLLFAGASLAGGDGALSAGDTLVADFQAYQVSLGATGGVVLSSYGRGSFGDAVLAGFERLVVSGSDFQDAFTGGARADFIAGEGGVDQLDGGSDNVRDVLLGGAGGDGFSWYNGGPDAIFGDDGRSAIGTPADVDTLLISANGAETHGLRYDLLARTSVDQALAGAVGARTAFGPGVVAADSSLDDLFTFRGLLLNAVPLALVPAVSFDAGDNASFMTYAGIEQVNVVGSDRFDDLVVYQGGATYRGGEAAGDADTFVADFSADPIAIDFSVDGAGGDAPAAPLANGVLVDGMERVLLLAGSGDDLLRGGDLDDFFDGGAGDDEIWGLGGDDVVNGGAGNDIVYWNGDGNDFADGGAGDDSLWVGGASLGMRVSGSFGDTGLLTADSGSAALVDLLRLLALSDPARTLQLESGGQVLTCGGFESVNAIGQPGSDHLVVHQGGKLYAASGGARDVFAGSFEDQSADLRFEADSASGAAEPALADIGNGVILGGFERWVLRLGSGNDTVTGGALDDWVDGGAGNDVLRTGAGGADSLFGGGGDDTLGYSGGTALLDGGSGDDTASLENFSGNVQLTLLNGDQPLSTGRVESLATRSALSAFVAQLQSADGVRYDQAGGSVTLKAVETVAVTSGAGNDVLLSGAAGGRLLAGDGDDVLLSQGGNDLLVGGPGLDTYVFSHDMGDDVIGGEVAGGAMLVFVDLRLSELAFSLLDNHLVIGTSGGSVTVLDYFQAGGNGLDLVFDTLDFHGSQDLRFLSATPVAAVPPGLTLNGTDGDDSLSSPGTGRNTVLAGAGDDFFVAGPGVDLFDGGSGADVVSYADSFSGVEVDLQTSRGSGGDAAGDLLVNVEGVIGGQGSNTLRGDEQSNLLAGGDADDHLDGRGGDDFLVGAAGPDELLGGAGNDVLIGGDGDDRLDGGAGDDMLDGGAGRDSVYGGDGDDLFTIDPAIVASATPGFQIIEGGAGFDTADFSGLPVAIVAWYLVGQPGHGQVSTGGPDFASLSGIERLIGTAYDDRLSGTALNDVLVGGAGDDVLDGFTGSDTLDGGDGIDTGNYTDWARSAFSIVIGDAEVQLTGPTPADVDTLTGVERLHFSDQWVALDLGGHAGTTAKILSAVFGREALQNQVYAGIGLQLLDGGTSYEDLMKLALDARLGPNASNEAVVDLLYTHVAGVHPSAGDLAAFTGLIEDGSFTPVSLGIYACEHEANQAWVALIGADGLGYVV